MSFMFGERLGCEFHHTIGDMPKRQRKKRAVARVDDVTPSHGRRVLAIPEFLAGVIHELDTKERRKLMHISKHFFQAAGPIVWKSVPGIDLIMRLIKGTKVKVDWINASHKYQLMTITLASKPNLRRYNIYAPWVRQLEIYGGYYQELVNPSPLLNLLGARPPLPNLRRLTASTTAPVDENNLINFLTMFVNPSLTEIRTIIPQKGLPEIWSSRIPSSSVPDFLTRIKKTCPEIQVLEFYPETTYASEWSERYIPNDQSRNILSSFSSLRSFSSTTYIFEPAVFRLIGELPHLESLGIRGSTTELAILNRQFNLSIPETWFPVLKDLRLYDIDPEDIQALWKYPTIVQKLVSALILTDDTTRRNPCDISFKRWNWVGPFLVDLPSLSPHLKDVTFCMGNSNNKIEIPRHHWGRFRPERWQDLTRAFYYYQRYLELGYEL
ncbi:unnamed protein product [Rhizoctonia solani]|uniref:Uncharacterized protein n=1 Tax=Rhizoctonia solani TaxID=456999 RepID=A0A8H3GE29_9AGAM|nr:unnamed protein product [Rhizoctonia solani]